MIYIKNVLVTILIAWYFLPFVWTFVLFIGTIVKDFKTSVKFCKYITKSLFTFKKV